jgi:hypothetical protein
MMRTTHKAMMSIGTEQRTKGTEMNIAIKNEIVKAIDVKVSTSILSSGDVQYSLTKKIDGKPQTVDIAVTSYWHNNLDAEAVAKVIINNAKDKFAKLRHVSANVVDTTDKTSDKTTDVTPKVFK